MILAMKKTGSSSIHLERRNTEWVSVIMWQNHLEDRNVTLQKYEMV